MLRQYFLLNSSIPIILWDLAKTRGAPCARTNWVRGVGRPGSGAHRPGSEVSTASGASHGVLLGAAPRPGLGLGGHPVPKAGPAHGPPRGDARGNWSRQPRPGLDPVPDPGLTPAGLQGRGSPALLQKPDSSRPPRASPCAQTRQSVGGPVPCALRVDLPEVVILLGFPPKDASARLERGR